MVIKKPDPDKVFKPVLPKAAEQRSAKASEGSIKAQKTAARLAAVQVLYQMDLNSQNANDAVREFMVHRIGYSIDGDVFVPAEPQLLQDIVQGVEERSDDIATILKAALKEGGKSNVEILLECILRCGIFELLAHSAVDTGIIINDYLNVTGGFYEGNETKIVNAILDKVSKKLRSASS